MTFAQEGHALMVGIAIAAAATYLGAMKLRSWPMWLAAFGLTILALAVAWQFRVPGVIETAASAMSAPGHFIWGSA